MNMAISNATNLQSVEDVISFGAARDMFNSIDEKDREAFLEIMNELNNEYYKATAGIPAFFGESGNKVGSNKATRLNEIMDRLELRLNTPLELHVVTENGL